MSSADTPPAYTPPANTFDKLKIIYPVASMSAPKTSLTELSPSLIEELKRQIILDDINAKKEKEDTLATTLAIWSKPEMRLEYILGQGRPIMIRREYNSLHYSSHYLTLGYHGILFQNSRKELITIKPKKTNYDAPLIRFYDFKETDHDEYKSKFIIEPLYSLDSNEKIPNNYTALGIIISAICDIFTIKFSSSHNNSGMSIHSFDKYWEFAIYHNYKPYAHPFYDENQFGRFNKETKKYIQYNNISVFAGETKEEHIMYVKYEIFEYQEKKKNVYMINDKSKKECIEPFTTHNELITILSKWKLDYAPHILI
jgi:hypothetical protein